MTRRKFGFQCLTCTLSLLLLGGWGCSKASDLIQSLRQILKSVETALGALSLLQGLLPDVVNKVAAYLLSVAKFVDDVGQLLESDTVTAGDKARQILQWASTLVMPVIPPPIGPILTAVAAAVDAFLSHFGANQQNAGAQARSVQNVPNISLSQADRTMLAAIHSEALTDSQGIREWAAKAGGTAK